MFFDEISVIHNFSLLTNNYDFAISMGNTDYDYLRMILKYINDYYALDSRLYIYRHLNPVLHYYSPIKIGYCYSYIYFMFL